MQNAIIFPFTDYMPLPRVGWGGGGLMLPRNFNIAPEPSVLNHLSTFFFYNYYPIGSSLMGNSGCFHRGNQRQQGHTIQSLVHTGCFSVSVTQQILTQIFPHV